MDGKEGPQTQRALSRTTKQWLQLIESNIQRISTIEAMEHGILINIATYSLYALYQGDISHQQKVVVGGVRTPTPLLKCAMDSITLHPSWGVPPSIFLRTLRNKVRDNPDYLNDHQYIVRNRDGNIVNPSHVNWDVLTPQYFPYSICQKPGPANSLGTIRFHLDNPENIHLHDTLRKDLFAKNTRAFSSGCVRLEKPGALAEWLGLPYDDKTPPQHVSFKQTLPVVFAYITLWFEGDTLYVSDDPYHYDDKPI